MKLFKSQDLKEEEVRRPVTVNSKKDYNNSYIHVIIKMSWNWIFLLLSVCSKIATQIVKNYVCWIFSMLSCWFEWFEWVPCGWGADATIDMSQYKGRVLVSNMAFEFTIMFSTLVERSISGFWPSLVFEFPFTDDIWLLILIVGRMLWLILLILLALLMLPKLLGAAANCELLTCRM